MNFGTVSPVVSSASYKAGALTNNTIAWTSSALPQNGKIELDFPVGYDLSGTLAVVSGNTGATVSASGNTLILNLGTAIAANSPVSLEVSGIKIPYSLAQPEPMPYVPRMPLGHRLTRAQPTPIPSLPPP